MYDFSIIYLSIFYLVIFIANNKNIAAYMGLTQPIIG